MLTCATAAESGTVSDDALSLEKKMPNGEATMAAISVITTKRAYEELESEGFIYTVPGKGSFVAPKNLDLIREQNLRLIEEHISEITRLASSCSMSRDAIKEMIDILWEE